MKSGTERRRRVPLDEGCQGDHRRHREPDAHARDTWRRRLIENYEEEDY
jgi:hypothetical protein